MRPDELKGVIPAIATPFDEDQNLDLDGLRVLTDFVISNGVHAIMTTGGTGEFPSLSREEKRLVTETVVEISAGRVPVIAGTAACSTKEVILLSNDAQESGANAVIVTAPYYFKLPNSSLLKHYKTIAQNIDCPLVVYNNPLYTGNDMNPDLIADLLKENNIIGMKQSNSDMGQLIEIIRISPEDVSICTGIDSQFYPALSIGAIGIYSTAATVMPAQMVKVYNLFQEEKFEEALALHMKLQALNKYLEYDPGYVAPAKEALNLLGLSGGYTRLPLPELTKEEKTGIRKALETIGLL